MPGHRNEFIVSPNAIVCIAAQWIMDVKTRWSSILEGLEQACLLGELTHEWLKNPKYSDYWPLLTTYDEWSIVKYMMDILWPFWYWTLWLSKSHTVTLHHIITVHNDMFDHMNGVMGAVAEDKTQWQEDLYFAAKLAWQKLSKYYAEVTPTMDMLLISPDIPYPFRNLRLTGKRAKGINMNPVHVTFCTTQYPEAFLK